MSPRRSRSLRRSMSPSYQAGMALGLGGLNLGSLPLQNMAIVGTLNNGAGARVSVEGQGHVFDTTNN